MKKISSQGNLRHSRYMRVRIPNWIVNIGLFLFSLTIILFVGEIGILFLNPKILAEQSLMYSSQTFQLDQNGAVRYQPNKNIRTVAVYNNKIEYDVHFKTNNLGFIDDKDYEYENAPNKRYYAFVGDSFTAGVHGGEPWIPKLRSNLEEKNIEIFNLGISGTGIEHFYRLLKSTSEQLNITHIVIVAISNDFQRHFWYPLANSSEIRFCREHASECIKRPYIATIIHPTSSIENILKVADNTIKDNGKYFHGSGIRGVLKQSKLLTFVFRSLKTILQKKTINTRNSFSLDALRNIRDAFPSTEIYFIHLPQKQEVINGEYFLDNIGKEIKKIGISYFPALKEWNWQKDMFFVNDAHPNTFGYNNIKNYVSSYIFADKELAYLEY